MTDNPKKLIEVALPLEDINAGCAREKSIRHGHPSTLHLWWARRPLAAARAVIFSQTVDDPSGYVDELRKDADLLRVANRELKELQKVWKNKKAVHDKAMAAGMKSIDPGKQPTLDDVLIERERERLFDLIRQLVLWENTTNESVLEPCREEMRKSWRRQCRRDGKPENTPLPAFHDPFAGGGALPLEAQRLGLESHASDLNPVAVLINKAMIEIPPKFAGKAPVNPAARKEKALIARQWKGAQGLAEDVRHYGQWMRDAAEQRIGALYPNVAVTAEMAKERPDLKPYVGQQLTVIAWLWARTVKSPNPAFASVDVPLASTFMLSTKAGKEAYVEPVIEGAGYRFIVKVGKPKDAKTAKGGTKLSRGANFACLMSGTPMAGDYIKGQGKAGRMCTRLMAIVAEGTRGRVYLAPTPEHEMVARNAKPEWKPEVTISGSTQYLGVKPYGMDRFNQLFTDRQLVALTTFSDLVGEAMQQVRRDALQAGLSDDPKPMRDGGTGVTAYAEAVGVYLGFALQKAADYNSSVCSWINGGETMRNTFGRQAIPMVWDFAEANPIGEGTGSFLSGAKQGIRVIQQGLSAGVQGNVTQADAHTQTISADKLVSTDPPYYDNVPYADLSDFFYVWLRRSLRGVFPDLFATLAVPKAEELVAFAYRHEGGKSGAEAFFLDGMTQAMHQLVEQSHPAFPVTIYYAFKQAENDTDAGTSSTGWETFLDSIVRAGFAISGTWPMRTELANRMRGMESNALASSIVLVCRPRSIHASMATRREFSAALQRELPVALRDLQHGNIAPVDLPQSAIGPGMAIFTRYSKIIEADGEAMSVRSALQLINATVDEFLSAQEAQMDDWTRFAVTWFSQHAYKAGPFGDALNMATARNVSVDGVRDAGILESGGGKVRILKPKELDISWDPSRDERLTVWEIVHHLIRLLDDESEASAAAVIAKIGALADDARSLCYRLYTICEQKKWAEDARDYNTLIVAWPELTRLAQEKIAATPVQQELI